MFTGELKSMEDILSKLPNTMTGNALKNLEILNTKSLSAAFPMSHKYCGYKIRASEAVGLYGNSEHGTLHK